MSTSDLLWAAIPSNTLNIPATLASGQAFRWRKNATGEWMGVIADAVIRLRPGRDGFWWQTYPVPNRWDLLQHYFALDVDLEALYAEWMQQEPRIARVISQWAGMRILRQGPEEAFFAFLCACCNTIAKITRSVQALACRYGEPIVEIEGEVFHRFPSATRLAQALEEDLRADLWGFRAPRVIQLAQRMISSPNWWKSLCEAPYREAHAELTGLVGIGAKIADCICLFALGHDEAVPIDRHIYRLGVRLFRPDLAGKSLTSNVYWAIGEAFRKAFGKRAGWAQQYLFIEEISRNPRTSRQTSEGIILCSSSITP